MCNITRFIRMHLCLSKVALLSGDKVNTMWHLGEALRAKKILDDRMLCGEVTMTLQLKLVS